MDKKLNRLQLYSSITASTLVFIIYLIICYTFSAMDLLEMIVVFVSFILPVVAAIPFYITEE